MRALAEKRAAAAAAGAGYWSMVCAKGFGISSVPAVGVTSMTDVPRQTCARQ
jgi:hypothetical protein